MYASIKTKGLLEEKTSILKTMNNFDLTNFVKLNLKEILEKGLSLFLIDTFAIFYPVLDS